jgi:ubiquinone/menaquinone biosynthesis C-methylase UbiE
MNDRHLWNKLAKENWKFYIYNNKGRDISDGDFIQSGEEDYKKLVIDDEIITAHFAHKENCTALEIGCGAGRLLRPMAKDFGRVIGIDVSEEMIKHARDRVDAELIVTDGASIPLEDNSVDFVFSYLVFQHIKSYVTVEDNFMHVARILKPGGIFKVLMRTELIRKDKVWYDRHFQWWEGVPFKQHMLEHLIKRFKFKLLKEELTGDGRVWMWLEK